jgi:hypothetical protein
MSMKKFSDSIGNRARDLPVCSAVPQPLRHRVPPFFIFTSSYYVFAVYVSEILWVLTPCRILGTQVEYTRSLSAVLGLLVAHAEGET